MEFIESQPRGIQPVVPAWALGCGAGRRGLRALEAPPWSCRPAPDTASLGPDTLSPSPTASAISTTCGTFSRQRRRRRPAPGDNAGAHQALATGRTPFRMRLTALGAQGLPDQRLRHGHGRLPKVGSAPRERLGVGMMVQSIAPHHAGLGDWYMQQPTLQKVRDWQGHALQSRTRAVSLLLPGARGEGDVVPVPRDKPGILEGAAAQIAGEIRDDPRAVRRALHDP